MILKRKGEVARCGGSPRCSDCRRAEGSAEVRRVKCLSVFLERFSKGGVGKWDDLTVSFKIALRGKIYAKANIY